MKKVTSFTHLVTGEGDRIAFTFSEISDTGELVSQNNKGNFIIVESSIKSAVDTINQYITQRLEGIIYGEFIRISKEHKFPCGGAPSDDDYFIFGKSDLKKVSWKSIKDTIMGRTYQSVETNIGINANVYKRCGVVYFRMGGYITKSIPITFTQICVLPDGYRPVSTLTLAFVISIASNYGFYLQIDTSGAVKIRGSKTIESGEGVNAMISYVT